MRNYSKAKRWWFVVGDSCHASRITLHESRFTTCYHGFTLVEAILAMVILTIAAAGVLLPFTYGAMVRAEGSKRTLATKLACDLMEQIISTDYSSILAAYASYSEAQGQVKDINGIVFTDTATYANFSRSAVCAAVYMPQQPGTDPAVFIRATVTVYYLGEEVASVTRLIGEPDDFAVYKSWSIGNP